MHERMPASQAGRRGFESLRPLSLLPIAEGLAQGLVQVGQIPQVQIPLRGARVRVPHEQRDRLEVIALADSPRTEGMTQAVEFAGSRRAGSLTKSHYPQTQGVSGPGLSPSVKEDVDGTGRTPVPEPAKEPLHHGMKYQDLGLAGLFRRLVPPQGGYPLAPINVRPGEFRHVDRPGTHEPQEDEDPAKFRPGHAEPLPKAVFAKGLAAWTFRVRQPIYGIDFDEAQFLRPGKRPQKRSVNALDGPTGPPARVPGSPHNHLAGHQFFHSAVAKIPGKEIQNMPPVCQGAGGLVPGRGGKIGGEKLANFHGRLPGLLNARKPSVPLPLPSVGRGLANLPQSPPIASKKFVPGSFQRKEAVPFSEPVCGNEKLSGPGRTRATPAPAGTERRDFCKYPSLYWTPAASPVRALIVVAAPEPGSRESCGETITHP